MSEELREGLIADYLSELETARQWANEGRQFVDSGTAGVELSRGRARIPLDEYITYWTVGLKALRNGADPEAFNY